MYMKNDKELLTDFSKTRNLKQSTTQSYITYIQNYTQYQGMSMVDLINEAEEEENNGVRWKHRQLKKRLIDYRAYLYDNYLKSSAGIMFSKILTLYRHYEIEIHQLPTYSEKNVHENKPITFVDLPDADVIKKALDISSPRMRAMILFISSSGCSRIETLQRTVQDFINATSDYHNSDEIYDVLNILKDKKDLVPRWELQRPKTGKYYTTFTSPEATSELVNYLISSNRDLKNTDRLFNLVSSYATIKFERINDKLGLGKRGTYNRFRPHMLRKYHASQLFNDGCSIEFVDALQGRGKDATHSSYFMEDPEKLRKEYIEHLDCLMVNWNSIDYKSPEYLELEQKYNDKEAEVESMNTRLASIEEVLFNDDVRSIVERFKK